MATIRQIKDACSARIFQFYPEHKQRNYALGVQGTEEEKAQCVAFIQSCISRCDELEAQASGETEMFDDVKAQYQDLVP